MKNPLEELVGAIGADGVKSIAYMLDNPGIEMSVGETARVGAALSAIGKTLTEQAKGMAKDDMDGESVLVDADVRFSVRPSPHADPRGQRPRQAAVAGGRASVLLPARPRGGIDDGQDRRARARAGGVLRRLGLAKGGGEFCRGSPLRNGAWDGFCCLLHPMRFIGDGVGA